MKRWREEVIGGVGDGEDGGGDGGARATGLRKEEVSRERD